MLLAKERDRPKSIFNVLGPLTNPAGAKKQVMGVYDKRWMLPIAEVLRELGSEHLLIIHSEDGLDEISIASKTYVTEMERIRFRNMLFVLKTLVLKPLRLMNLLLILLKKV